MPHLAQTENRESSFIMVSSNAAADTIFVYTGLGGERPPRDVVRVRVDPSVTSIPVRTFYARKKLTEVELCEGLVEIGISAFAYCEHSISKINIPISLRRIRYCAFHTSLRCPIRLHDGIEIIGDTAFARCAFTNFRVPPLITVVPKYIFSNCMSMFSLELPEGATNIESGALKGCFYLRNVAFPPGAIISDEVFRYEYGGRREIEIERYDLYQLFGSIAEIMRELRHRFDELPIHRLVYYQSYHQGVLQMLIGVINSRQCQLNLTGNQQDCLGMTPLHILACSSVHDIEVYRGDY